MKNVLLTLLLLCLPVAAFAADTMRDMEMRQGVDQALSQSMQQMMNGMHASMTGNADVDFVAMMIPHHQGAIDMCKVELQYGKDVEIRQLCANIIAAQDQEIAQMKAWQATHGG